MKNKVVVVDDNKNNLLLEKDLLELDGFEVFTARDATGGIEAARSINPDVIVMDVRLPDMRGTDAAMILRQDRLTEGIPIVFVTASVMEEGLEEVRGVINSGFIGKPIDTRTFAKTIRGFIR
ncbi:MAG: response regulator [Candidatus Goldiibacteriota bacterium HGW-Goldbacteria-1]|nr:MAG: response regulator [Candidatus Goldiibacteriota bacterium HGW-Goldbacteria-1]